MAITSLDGYIGSNKTNLTYYKSGTLTSVAAMPFSLFNQAGNPGPGTLPGGQSGLAYSGFLCTSTNTSGYPAMPLNPTGTLYLSRVDFASTVAARIGIYDRIEVAGPYTISGVYAWPHTVSFSGRVPGDDFRNLQLWMETSTAFTGNPTVSVGYLQANNVSGQVSFATGAALTVNRCMQIPISGGISKITHVSSTVATAGVYNLMVLRPLWTGRVPIAGAGDIHDFLKTGLPVIYSGTALYVLLFNDTTTTGLPYLTIEVADG